MIWKLAFNKTLIVRISFFKINAHDWKNRPFNCERSIECAFQIFRLAFSLEHLAIVFHFDWLAMKIALRFSASSIKIDDNKFHIRWNYFPSPAQYLHRLVHIIIIMQEHKASLANVLHYTLGLVLVQKNIFIMPRCLF